MITLYDMHTKYFSSELEGINGEGGHKILNTRANHIAWIAGSLVHERFERIHPNMI